VAPKERLASSDQLWSVIQSDFSMRWLFNIAP
jgi:hypothetical protein